MQPAPSNFARHGYLMSMTELTISLHRSIDQIAASDWDGCGASANPFTTHRFLLALEVSGSVGEGTGWYPHHVVARRANQIVGVAPCYLKTHSQGEYIFDHGWAEAWQRAGGQYYPKLQVAVPFTPVTGPRLISDDPDVQAAMLEGLRKIAQDSGISGVHVTFCTQSELELGAQHGFLPRSSQQFHWPNPGYDSYDDFLGQLSSRKRKALRKERERAQEFGGTIVSLTGDEIRPEHWDAFWQFYQDTGSRKWGRPYLTRAFFDQLQQTMRDDCVLVLALREDGMPIAGALNLLGPDAIYGRYWGTVEDHPFLHFELCYHRAMDWAIAHRLPRVEAGAQGEHKLARGYLPSETHSLHWVSDEGFYRAVADFLRRETDAVNEDIAILTELGPFRRDETTR